jgi:hypothetical protein
MRGSLKGSSYDELPFILCFSLRFITKQEMLKPSVILLNLLLSSHVYRDSIVKKYETLEDLIWNDILLLRNSTAHIYDEEDYEEIKNKIINDYTDAIEDLLSKISKVVI